MPAYPPSNQKLCTRCGLYPRKQGRHWCTACLPPLKRRHSIRGQIPEGYQRECAVSFSHMKGSLGEIMPGYEIGWGYCQCGCGKQTNQKRGFASRFLPGHSSKIPSAREAQSRRGLKQLELRKGDPLWSKWPTWPYAASGMHYSPKLEAEISYMSSLEKRAFEILDGATQIKCYEIQPYPLQYEYRGEHHNYIPDILVTLSSGERFLAEVKPESMVNDPKVAAKAIAAEQYCQRMGYRFVFWTEKLLELDLPAERIVDLLLK